MKIRSMTTVLCALGLYCAAGQAFAVPVLITAPQTLNPGATTITPTAGGAPVALGDADITVTGTTLTVNGRYTIKSLALTGSATVTHGANFSNDYSGGAGTDVVNGLSLITTGDVTIDAGSSVSATGRGFPGTQGPGAGGNSNNNAVGAAGGGYGGPGGAASPFPGGIAYGSLTAPTDFGSGGGSYVGNPAGAGGGAVRLSVGGTLTNNGTITAAGAAGPSASGGGSGGSVWLSAATFSGSGSVLSNGGAGGSGFWGAGGGGRIAIQYTTNVFSGTIQAYGALGSTRAGAGSIYLKAASQSLGDVIMANSGAGARSSLPTAVTSLRSLTVINNCELLLDTPLTAETVLVTGGGVLAHTEASTVGLNLTVTGNLTIDPSGSINVTGRGYPSTQGPGAGGSSNNSAVGGAGGGYGGYGAAARGFLGGVPYGSITQPTDLGSGGGAYVGSPAAPGGGAIRLSVNGTLTNNGSISAGGNVGPSPAGSGSGGSIWITAGTITGAGTIAANGANGSGGTWGAGGGGRISITSTTSSLVNTPTAFGGAGGEGRGGEGTVYTKVGAQPAQLLFDNNNGALSRTILTAPLAFTGNVVIRNGVRISGTPGDPVGVNINVIGNLSIDATSSIDQVGRGFAAAQGPGAGTSSTNGGIGGAGGGHGGSGATSGSFLGGLLYGSVAQPIAMGSGGGDFVGNVAGSGGGVVRIQVSGTFTNDGALLADGNTPPSSAGAGSGGSIWITTPSLLGAGVISANGATGGSNAWGAGGGGRIAIDAPSGFAGVIRAFGGNGSSARAGAGTVHFNRPGQMRELVYDNGGGTIGLTTLAAPLTFNGNVIMRNGVGFIHTPGDVNGVQIKINGDLTTDASFALPLAGRGYSSNQGPGAGTPSNNGGIGGGGAGHGGVGGNSGLFPGGPVYGDPSKPTLLGSGGGAFIGNAGGNGGGAALINVSGVFSFGGSINVNGTPSSSAAGSGSGGSVWLIAGALTGSGVISANGANTGAGWGPGGGGRIAIYSCNQQIPVGNFTVNQGTGGSNTAQPGSILFGSSGINFSQQPPTITTLVGQDIVLEVNASTTNANPSVSYQWRRKNILGTPVNLIEGEGGGRYTGVNTRTLGIDNSTCGDSGEYDCLVSDACGSFPSDGALLTVNTPADFNGDGFLTFEDFDDYVAAFEAGDAGADFNQDGFLTFEDFDSYVLTFESGC
jgi:hypothetical protein